MGRKSQEARGYVAYARLHRLSWGGSWALLALILPHFFAFVFNIDFSSIFSRFRKGFGRVLGGQNGPKIEIFDVFFGMLFETLFLVNFCLIFEKIDDEKHMEFCLFFNRLFDHLFVQFDAFLYARNLKNSDFT